PMHHAAPGPGGTLSPGKSKLPTGKPRRFFDADDFIPLGGTLRAGHGAHLDLLAAEADGEMAEAHVLALPGAARLDGVPAEVARCPGRGDELGHRPALVGLEEHGVAGATGGAVPNALG